MRARLAARQSCRPARFLAILLLLTGICSAATPSEYQVKAVFLFNFTQFVVWPPRAFASADAPFVIGILGKDPFGSQLDQVVRGETVDKRPLVIQRYATLADIRDCNILFIDRAQVGDLPQILAALKGRSVLTVTDADDTSQRGVVIRLLTQNNRIRLRIDVAAARASSLTISSKLLRPAEIVDAEG